MQKDQTTSSPLRVEDTYPKSLTALRSQLTTLNLLWWIFDSLKSDGIYSQRLSGSLSALSESYDSVEATRKHIMAIKTITKYVDDGGAEHHSELDAAWANRVYAIRRHLRDQLGWDREHVEQFIQTLSSVNPQALAPIADFLGAATAKAQDRMDRTKDHLSKIFLNAEQPP